MLKICDNLEKCKENPNQECECYDPVNKVCGFDNSEKIVLNPYDDLEEVTFYV